MRTETASSQTREHRGAWSALCATLLLATGAAGISACKSNSSVSPADAGGTAPPPADCSANASGASGDAVALTSAQSVSGRICYAGKANWYHLAVPAGSTLLDVTAGYPPGVVTPVRLDVKVFTKTNDTSLTQLQELRAPAQSDAGLSSIATTLLVPGAGDYYVEVADAQGSGVDPANGYTLSVSSAADPDSHEPNDSPAAAKPTDSKPGYLAYLGDVDVFSIAVANATDLVMLNLSVPAAAPAPVNYQITSTSGAVVASGSVGPTKTPLDTVFPVSGAGTYYLSLSYPPGTPPGRAPGNAYTVTLGTTADPDTAPHHTIATATCPGGGSGPCTMAYSGTAVSLPAQTGYIAVPGQRDLYRVDVTSGAALVLQMDLTSSSSTVKYAVDLLTPDPASSCKVDSDCTALDQPCTQDSDCELSHACLPPGQYKFCPNGGVSCRLCGGAGLCIPGSSGGVCAASQYLSAYVPAGAPTGGPSVSSAQPLFTEGAYYVSVHDATYTGYDDTNSYTLKLKMVPEPDPNDRSSTPAGRNNFYNPYPTATTDRTPNKQRAVPLTAAQLQAGVTGYISYQTDEDWYVFSSPCDSADAGATCGIDFQWTQPASAVKVALFVLDENTLLPQESFAYSGSVPPPAPVLGNFDNSSCSSCSFGNTGKKYYMQVTDIHEQAWDYGSAGEYSFKVSSVTAGCPGVCSGGGGSCVSQCVASNTCCPQLQ
jgi:hypothetical protein